MNFEFYKCGNDDIGELAIMNKQLIVDEGHSNPMDIAQLADRMKSWINDNYTAYGAKYKSILIGYCLVRDDGDYIYIRQIFIRENYRMKGYGKNLVNWLRVSVFQGRKFRMEVLCNNIKAHKFWEKIGFSDYSIMMEL